jgi:lysophospholipase L1-like esterase
VRQLIARAALVLTGVATLIASVVPAPGALASAGAAQPTQDVRASAAAAAEGSSPAGIGAHWLGTWEAAPSGANELGCANCTIRNIVHTSIGGQGLRIRISNVFGTAPLQVTHATVALSASPNSANVAPGALREVTFADSASVTIPAGQDALSDPVPLAVPANSDLLVTTFTPGDPTPFTWHPDAQEISYYTSGADEADATSASAFTSTTESWYLLMGVDVTGTQARGDVVAFGDSITDGYQSTTNLDARWPNILADRLLALPEADQMGVLNAGISGNRILLDGGNGFGPTAISRFRRDVIDQSGVRAVIILLGINDIQQTPNQLDPSKIIAGLQNLIDQAHAAGIRVIGATLTPFEGWTNYGLQTESTRDAVNHWIRTSGAYDGVADFDALTRDPADPSRILPAFDSGDHLHPDDAGYMAMGASFNLQQLGAIVPPQQTGPEISSLVPATALPGRRVTIRGNGFGATQGSGYIQFTNSGNSWGAPGDQATLQVDSWSDRAVAFTIPEPSGVEAWHVETGTTATVNVVSSSGAVSATATLPITPTASLADYYGDPGISSDASQACGNLDGAGFSYSQQALAAAGLTPAVGVTADGLAYTWPDTAACAPDNILSDAQTVLANGTKGQTTLGLLGSSTNGASTGVVLIHYSDGTTSRASVTFGNWADAPVTGDTAVATMPYRNSSDGTSQQATVYVFVTTVPVDPQKTVVSVTLPEIGSNVGSMTTMHIFAISLGTAS